jgi:outer membrane receptor for ferrienterochelin and colicin
LTQQVRYHSPQYSEADRGGVKVPSFYVWNVRLSFKIWSADLFAQLDNLTRRRYAETALTGDAGTFLAPQPERVYWVGVRIRFLD